MRLKENMLCCHMTLWKDLFEKIYYTHALEQELEIWQSFVSRLCILALHENLPKFGHVTGL